LFKRVKIDGQIHYFFFALPGVEMEFALDKGAAVSDVSGSVETVTTAWGSRLLTRGAAEIGVNCGAHLVIMQESEAEQIWRGDVPQRS
jgi:hypothetical protein